MHPDTANLALVVSAKRHGERGAIVSLLCAENGMTRGLMTLTKANQAFVITGNTVRYEHFRRLPNQLGKLTLELVHSRSAAMVADTRGALIAGWLREVLGSLLPEGHPYPVLYGMVEQFLDGMVRGDISSLWRRIVALELRLLREVGYGLSLDADGAVPCAEGSALTYVSPRSGRAVSAAVGAPYANRLLPLPHVFGGPVCAEQDDITRALQLTGTFLKLAAHGHKLTARNRLVDWLRGELEQHLERKKGHETHNDDACGANGFGEWRIAS